MKYFSFSYRKASIWLLLTGTLAVSMAGTAQAQDDDIYATPKQRQKATKEANTTDPVRTYQRPAQRSNAQDATEDAYADTPSYGSSGLASSEREELRNIKRSASDYYADDESYYSNLIRRFSDPWAYNNSFYGSPVWGGYGGYGYGSGLSVSIGFGGGWGWGAYQPWGYINPWYNPFYNPFWCPSPYAFGFSYSPWNYYGCYSPYGFGGGFYNYGFGGLNNYNYGGFYGERPNTYSGRGGTYNTYDSNPGRGYYGNQVRTGTRGGSTSGGTRSYGSRGNVGGTPAGTSSGQRNYGPRPQRTQPSARPTPSSPGQQGARPAPTYRGGSGNNGGGSYRPSAPTPSSRGGSPSGGSSSGGSRGGGGSSGGGGSRPAPRGPR